MSHAALNDDDKQVLMTLAEHGEYAPDTPRHTLLYFVTTSESDSAGKSLLDNVADLTRRAGWDVASREDGLLVVEKDDPVDQETVANRTAWAETLADEVGVEFDGWECQIITEEDLSADEEE